MSQQHALDNYNNWDLIDRLHKSLRVSGVSVSQMADALEKSRNTVGNYLAGRTNPDANALRTWAETTGVPLNWLRYGMTAIDPDGGAGQQNPPSWWNADCADVLNFPVMLPNGSALPVAA